MLNERIGPETARFAVLGQSLPHTWSPYIHNSLFDAAGLDAVYLPVPVPPERLGSVTDVFRSCFSGFNVTIPYKEKILPFLDDIDEAAQVCGAVNTVEIRNGRMIGHITDGLGMLRAIEERGVKTHQADVLILGGGGAARVAGYAFLSRGGRVTFAVRDTQKGDALAHALAQTQQDGLHRLSVRSLADCAEAHDILRGLQPQRNAAARFGKAKRASRHRGTGHAVLSGCGSSEILVWRPRCLKGRAKPNLQRAANSAVTTT